MSEDIQITENSTKSSVSHHLLEQWSTHGQFHSRVDYHKKVPGSMLFENFSTITEIRALNKVSTSLSPQLRQTFLISSNMPTVIRFAGISWTSSHFWQEDSFSPPVRLSVKAGALSCDAPILHGTSQHPTRFTWTVMWQEAHTLPMTCASCNWTYSNLQVCLWCYRLNKTTGMQNTYWNENFYRKKDPVSFFPEQENPRG